MSRSTPLRIGYLAQHFLPETGALPARIAEMSTRWRDAGAEVTVLTAVPHRPHGVVPAEFRGKLFQEEEWNGIRVIRSWLYATPRRSFARDLLTYFSFMGTGALSALRPSLHFDVLIASSPPFFVHPAGELIRRLRRVPLVLEVRDLWPDYLVDMGVLGPERPATRALFAVERYLLRRASRVVVVTESFRRRIAGKGVDPRRIEVIPNGVDVGQYFQCEEEPPLPALRRRSGEFLVGYLGNFGAGQDLATIVDAAAILAREAPGAGVRFVLAGDGPERERVLARWRQLGLSNLEICPGIPKEQTRAFYNACDLCLVPLAAVPVFQETVPSKIFEIMACERPLLASLGGEGARIIDQSGGGWVAPPGDPRGIAEAVLRVRDVSKEKRAQVGESGRAYVAQSYNRAYFADRYLDVLATAAGQGGEGRKASLDGGSRAPTPSADTAG